MPSDRNKPVPRWVIDNIDVSWGLYTCRCGDKGLCVLLMIDLSLRLKVYAAAIFFPITITRGVKAVLATTIFFGLFWPGCFRFFLRLRVFSLSLIILAVLFHVVYFTKQQKNQA